jgi:hypothetical protein
MSSRTDQTHLDSPVVAATTLTRGERGFALIAETMVTDWDKWMFKRTWSELLRMNRWP